MRFMDYLKDKIYSILLNIICMVFLSAYLLSIGTGISEILTILIFWAMVLNIFLFSSFHNRKKYLSKLMEDVESLDQKYLISEVIDKPYRFDDMVYYEVLRLANKSMLENIAHVRNDRKEYKEYIERWIHEVKTPISAIKLICENNKSDTTRRILTELVKTENYVEQALFYARSENVEKDYMIKEIKLCDCIDYMIIKNKQLLIQNDVNMQIEDCSDTVYTDSKWLEFILNQLIINSVKYRNEGKAVIKIYSKNIDNGIALYVEDNSIGVSQSDLPRIFEKGFTGKNGRNNQKSTGIGLYLCKRLCDKLGLKITANSEIHRYTRITIFFPKGTLVKIQD